MKVNDNASDNETPVDKNVGEFRELIGNSELSYRKLKQPGKMFGKPLKTLTKINCIKPKSNKYYR